jgi:orsellinic acid C2-O-methyltransferase
MTGTDQPNERARLLALIEASWTTQAIRAACLLELPRHLCAGTHDVATLAATTRSDAAALRRLLRALATIDVCREDESDRFSLTPTGALLCGDHPQSLRDWALQVGGPQWQRLGELAESVRSGQSWHQRHQGRGSYDALADDPDNAAVFHRAMVELTRRVAADVLLAVDFNGTRCVVDVGGGSGELLAAVLAAHPAARGVLFDQDHALAHASPVLHRVGVAARCECVAGSFFDGVPAEGDVYLLKSVLHNWDDERCIAILRRCREAMAAGARLLLIERLVPERVGASAKDRALARSDLTMLVGPGGRERAQREFVVLLEAAGLAVVQVHATRGAMSVIEAR